MKIAIVGTGPSGAFAYAGAQNCGLKPDDIDVYGNNIGLPSRGTFYVHWVPETMRKQIQQYPILTRGMGDKFGYVEKQWGADMINPKTQSSFPEQSRVDTGYNPSDVLPRLWGNDLSLIPLAGQLDDDDLRAMGQEYDFVFHTFPSEESKIQNAHDKVQFVVVIVSDEHRQDFISTRSLPQSSMPNYVLYNGYAVDRWSRFCRLFGTEYVEYVPSVGTDNLFGESAKFVQTDLHLLTQPWNKQLADNIFPVGRYARWMRWRLSHESYFDVGAVIAGDEGYAKT